MVKKLILLLTILLTFRIWPFNPIFVLSKVKTREISLVFCINQEKSLNAFLKVLP